MAVGCFPGWSAPGSPSAARTQAAKTVRPVRINYLGHSDGWLRRLGASGNDGRCWSRSRLQPWGRTSATLNALSIVRRVVGKPLPTFTLARKVCYAESAVEGTAGDRLLWTSNTTDRARLPFLNLPRRPLIHVSRVMAAGPGTHRQPKDASQPVCQRRNRNPKNPRDENECSAQKRGGCNCPKAPTPPARS